MIATGIPELTKKEDIHYMRDRLNLSMTDDEASEHFKKQIVASYKTKRFDGHVLVEAFSVHAL